MINLKVERVSSEARLIRITMNDTLPKEGEIYFIRRRLKNTAEEVIIRSIKADDIETINNSKEVTIKDSPELHGATYHYRVVRGVDEGTQTVASNDTVINTMPSRVEGFSIDKQDSEYDGNGVPTKIKLCWHPIDTANRNNENALGYNVYFSTSNRYGDEAGNWGTWSVLKGSSTEFSSMVGGGTNTIPIDKSEIEIEVPQLTSLNNPKDLRIAIVTISTDIGRPRLLSRFSDVASFILRGAKTTSIHEGSTGVLRYEEINDLVVEVTTLNGSFNGDTILMIKNRGSIPIEGHFEINNSFEITATREVETRLNVRLYRRMYFGQHYEVRMFDKSKGQWVPVPSSINLDESCVEFSIYQSGRYALLSKSDIQNSVNPFENHFSTQTNKIIDRLPTWSKIRRQSMNSMGASFLEVFGLELEEVKELLDYAQEQMYIETADEDQVSLVYVTDLPKTATGKIYWVKAEFSALQKVETLKEFYNKSDNLIRPTVYYDNPYIIDLEEYLIYVRKPYNPSKDFPHGRVYVDIYNEGDKEPSSTIEKALRPHHVWNFFDEFGLLLDVARLPMESNKEYKRRILDVFKNPSSASREGLMNGIARELGIRKHVIWSDTSDDLVIKDPMVIVNEIRVNGERFPMNFIHTTQKDEVLLKAQPMEYSNGSEVTYVSGLEMHTFFNKDDRLFRQQLYNVNGTATNRFKHYASLIKNEIPVEWGCFKWNEGYWLDDDKSGYLPSIMDANINGLNPRLVELVPDPNPIRLSQRDVGQVIVR